jgi:hypothetical protein
MQAKPLGHLHLYCCHEHHCLKPLHSYGRCLAVGSLQAEPSPDVSRKLS